MNSKYPEGEVTKSDDGKTTFIKGNDGYEYEIRDRFNLQTGFIFESEELEELLRGAHPGNLASTDQMRNFTEYEQMFGKEGSATRQRLMFYTNSEFSPEEKKMIEQYKQYCKENQLKIPAADPEILRFLYSKKKDPKQAYLATLEFFDWQKANYPRQVGGSIFELLNKGFIYVCGRDRFYRPILVINAYMIHTLDPSVEDLITLVLFYGQYLRHHMMWPGAIENLLQVMNLNNLAVS